jgi:hypothetical protein
MRELLVFTVRPFVGSDLRFVLAPAIGVALVGWVVCCARGLWEGESRARRFSMWLVVGVPVASVASGIVGGVPWGPVRYVQLASVGLTLAASVAALHSARVQAALRRDAAEAKAGGRPWSLRTAARSVVDDPVGLPWLFASLALLFVLRVREPRTAWSEAAAELRERAPPAAAVFVDDPGARVVLGHYLGRPVEVAPRDGTAEMPPGAWHARLDTSVARPFVRIEPR